MKAEIISIGDELLKGHRVNTNAPFIARQLGSIGIPALRVVTCSDLPEEIKAVVAESLERADIVLVTGGLGPTRDDRTRNAVQTLLGRGLELSNDAYKRLADWYRQRGRRPSDSIRDQAMVVEGSITIPNTKGTAPGMIITAGKQFSHHYLVLMPGVPSEMEAMMTLSVIPFFTVLSGSFILHTPVKTIGIGETLLAEMISPVEDSLPEGTTIAYLPHTTGVSLMVSTTGKDRQSAETDHQRVVEAVVEHAKSYVYATSETSLEEVVGEMLMNKGLTIAAAESCTGGLISNRLTNVPGSSGYFLQGLVTYSNRSKEELLGVGSATLASFGAVSEEVAREMAQGCLEKSGADLAVATTGIAGPSGASPEKPVGILCLGFAVKEPDGNVRTKSRTLYMHGSREQNKLRFSEAALREILEYLRVD
jgi:nicotinamide-nucleotide amidase